ncbi:MAG TPA: SPOR domain-containing protein [Blastocatellia bacterium]|nr:SPOR domain-containing protein [Blastocatellia bacterium]
MIVICPKCQFENKAETTHVICARCATLIEVRTMQGAAGSWGDATDMSHRVTKPMSAVPRTAPAPGNGAPRDPFATRVEPDADEVLDIPRISNGIYPVSESGAVFEDVLSAPGSGTAPIADYGEMPIPEKLSPSPVESLGQYPPVSPVTPVFSPPIFSVPATSGTTPDLPPAFPDPGFQNTVVDAKVGGWPVLPEDSFEAHKDSDSPLLGSTNTGRRVLLPVLLTILVFAGLAAAAWYFLGDKFTKRDQTAAKVERPPAAQPAKSNNPPANNGAPAGTATAPTAAPSVAPAANNAAAPAKTTDKTDAAAGKTAPQSSPSPAAAPSKAPAVAATNKTPIPVPVGPAGQSVSSSEGGLTVQVASYTTPAEADKRVASLKAAGVDARVVKAEVPKMGTRYRVQTGRFTSREEANRYASQLKARGVASDVMVTGYQAN